MAVKEQQVAELYVATFNRAPDSAGLAFWVNDSGFTIEQIATSFFDQIETQALYPPGTTEAVFVTSVYDNLFNRAPNAAGLDYWVDALGNGSLTRPVMIEAVKNGAQGADAEIVANKAEVGLYYANMGLNGTYSLLNITNDDNTVFVAKTDIYASQKNVSSTINVDIGTVDLPEQIDASGDDFKFADDVGKSNYVVISNFKSGDSIEVSGALGEDYSFSNSGADVEIMYDNDKVTNSIVLIGVVNEKAQIFDQGSFEAAIGFDAFFSI